MKRNVLTIISLFVALFGSITKSNGQTLLHYWNFNANTPASLTPTTSIITGANLSYYGASLDSVQQGTTVNGVGADGTALTASSAALRLRNPADSFIMSLPTTGYKNIVLAYAEQRTKKGAQQNIVTYTVDGTNWINTAISATATYWVDSTDTVSNTPYQLETFNFSSDAATNNNPNFKVCIRFMMGDTGSAGNNRFDNITLRGETVGSAGISEVHAFAGYSLHPNPATDSIEINSVLEGDKSVIITNQIGQNVYTGTASGKHFSVSTSKLAAGNYYVSIRENSAGMTTVLKFVKQ